MNIFDEIRHKSTKLMAVVDLAAFIWSHADHVHDALIADGKDLIAAELVNRVKRLEELQ